MRNFCRCSLFAIGSAEAETAPASAIVRMETSAMGVRFTAMASFFMGFYPIRRCWRGFGLHRSRLKDRFARFPLACEGQRLIHPEALLHAGQKGVEHRHYDEG